MSFFQYTDGAGGNGMKEIRGKYLLVLIAMCGVIAASIGITTNTAGVYITPVSEAFGVGKGAVSMTLTIANLVYAMAGLLAAGLFNRNSYRTVSLVSMIVLAASTAAMGLCQNMAMLYVCSAVRGLSAGLLGSVTATTILNSWFVKNAGLVTSIAFGFSGITGALLSPVISAIISRFNWQTGYFFSAVVIVLMELPAVLLPIAYEPEVLGMKALGYEESSEKEKNVEESNGKAVSLAPFLLVLVFASFAAFATALPTHLPGIAESYGLGVGALCLSVCMAANTGGKLLLGVLMDKFGEKRSILAYGCGIMAGLLLLQFVRVDFSMLAGAALAGLSYSLGTVGTVMVCRAVFGSENYGTVYPKVALGGTLSNAAGASIIGFIYDFTGGYSLALVLIFFMTAVSMIVVKAVLKH